MGMHEHGRRQQQIHFNEEAINLALNLTEKLEKTLALLYYQMEHYNQSIVIILISTDNMRAKEILIEQKRDTDLLYEIDPEKNIYAIICQSTRIDGGYIFEQRLERNIKEEDKKLFSAELELRTTKYPTKDVLMKLLEMYLHAVAENKNGEVVFRTLG